MSIKKTDLLAVELEVIADTIQGHYRQNVLKEAAERLRDLDGIAEFYHSKINNGRKELCKGTSQKR